MNVTANIRRGAGIVFLLALIVTSAGCAKTTSSAAVDKATTQVDTNVALAEPIAAGPQVEPVADIQQNSKVEQAGMIIHSRLVSAPSEKDIGIQLIEGDVFSRFIIDADVDPGEFSVMRLSAPDRLVIDLMNRTGGVNRTYQTEDSSLVRDVRTGAHSDKSRLVFDIRDGVSVEHHVDQNNGNLIVTFAPPEFMQIALSTASMKPAAKGRAALSPSAVSNTEASDTETQAIEPFSSPAGDIKSNLAKPLVEGDASERQIQQQQEGAADYLARADANSSSDEEDQHDEDADEHEGNGVHASGAADRPQVVGLSLEPDINGGNMLVAEMNAAGFFTLKKTAPSEYVLRLENAAVAPQANRTILAPPESGAIRSVRPVTEGSDTLLRIFAKPGTSLTARSQNGKIIVAANNSPDQNDIRAQLSDDEKGNANGEDDDISALLEETPKYTGRLISLDLQDTDIDNALRIIAEVSNLNIIASDDVTGKVTLRLIDVPWDQALDVILKTNGLDKVQELNVIRVAPVEKLREEREALKQAREAEEELEPLQVRYMRISYARASELKPLIETVLTERGSVSYDERTNQIIVKDIMRGIRNAAQLVAKLDLRTPQVLLETQIVEAQRSLGRDLGSELGFQLVQSPATGNATSYNFPNSITVGGSVDPASGGITASSFPAAISTAAGSAVNILLGSADGTGSLDMRLSALEKEGRIRVISRPSVATTNNQEAIIKSIEKIRVRTPSGGLSVATGQGASASGTSATATETIEIGITLTVTPQASPDYYVLLDVDAKSSSFGTREVDGIPSEVERSATSTVLVSSGQTFAMGGIYKITDRDNLSGVPFFKDIPFLGHLFRNSKVENSDEELIFFITPRIIEGSFDDAAMKVAS
ncbi:MAG: type IV pilus secretin family protein [Candidatus Dadabacteria bacterium]|nr:MAG: type IV pilus secretin family protein [Candidatus Dadabacteria bacterium]